jgi:nucleoside-diphosphate-sugar epimerase
MYTPVKKILVTGSSGFVGQRLVESLLEQGYEVIGFSRKKYNSSCPVYIGELDDIDSIRGALNGVDVVIHAAARSHVMNDESLDPLAEYRRVNVEGTRNVVTAAIEAGVKRCIYISSIKANGEQTEPGEALSHSSKLMPEDAYGISKVEAEMVLNKLAKGSALETVIIRPPLIYGPKVKGNFTSLVRLVKSRLPLPFGLIHNQRSFVFLGNLIDLIMNCVDNPRAVNQTFLVSDGDDLSTSELLIQLKQSSNGKAYLIPIPSLLLKTLLLILGKRNLSQKLLGNLQVDISHTCEILHWKPPYTVEQGLNKCHFHSELDSD